MHQQQMKIQQQQMENQQQQTTLLRDGLIAAQQAAIATIEKATAPREQRPDNVVNFKKLNPRMFAGTGKPLKCEQ